MTPRPAARLATPPVAIALILAIGVLGFPFESAAKVPEAGQAVNLSLQGFHDITFSGIPPTRYANEREGILVMTVDESASFLLKPFEQPLSVSKVSFVWRSDGDLRMTDEAMERTKAGDDARLRIGLIVSGPAPRIPFFAPAWIKAIRDTMKLPSNRILYLVPGARNPPGTRWKSPYSRSIELLSVESEKTEDGWLEANVELGEPLDLVGLWIMADGDSTGSTFETELKDLVLH